METQTQHIHCVLFHQNASDNDCNKGESEGKDLSMERVGEQMSTVINAVTEHQGEQSIESSIDTAVVDIETQEAFLTELRTNLSAHYPELLFSMASGIANSTSMQVIPTMLITPATFHHHPPYGLVPRIQVSVQYKVYTVTVLMRVRYLKVMMLYAR